MSQRDEKVLEQESLLGGEGDREKEDITFQKNKNSSSGSGNNNNNNKKKGMLAALTTIIPNTNTNTNTNTNINISSNKNNTTALALSPQIMYNTFEETTDPSTPAMMDNNPLKSIGGGSSSGGGDGGVLSRLEQNTFENFPRKSIKFWVLPSHFLTVKKRISKHITEWHFDNKVSKDLAQSGNIMHNIYFDTTYFDLYHRILQEKEDSMLFRYRWFSNEKPTRGFFEQELRPPTLRSFLSKRSFALAPNLVLSYIRHGKDVVPQSTPLMEVIHRDINKIPDELKHIIRSTYRRTVFQESEDAPIRISFDENITLIDVHSLSWEDACDPSYRVPYSRMFHFPLAVLEVKLIMQDEDEKELNVPNWVTEMHQSGLIIEVERFSKFCTGAAVMNLHTIHSVPSWLVAVKTMLEIELASKGKDWFGTEKDPTEEILTEKRQKPMQRIEPREYLSNERTLLKWVRMCFLALFVGLALLGFQHEPITGALLTGFALIILIRSYFMYHRRLKMLQTKDFKFVFYDPWGPTMILLLFVIPAISYFLFCLGVFNVSK